MHIKIFVFPYLNLEDTYWNMERFHFEYCNIENMYCFGKS